MTAAALVLPEPESLADTDAALDGMMLRTRTLLDAELTEDGFVELAAIYDNVSYIFLYLESNDAHINYRKLLPWRDRFYADRDLTTRFRDALVPLRCTDADVERARRAYIDQLSARIETTGVAEDRSMADLQEQAKAVIASVDNEHRALLGRLGVPTSGRAWPVFYKLLSATENPLTRSKLTRAWVGVRDRNQGELVRIIDRMVETRRRVSAERGYSSVLAGTLTRCEVDEAVAANFLDGYLARALVSHVRLEDEIRKTLCIPNGSVEDHFGRYVSDIARGRKVPLLRLDECLEFIFEVGRRTLGLELFPGAPTSPYVKTFDVALDGRSLGKINFDLWDHDAKPRSANTTRGIRNRTEAATVVQRPVAYVSCRFQQARDGTQRVNFQNVHSLFHEFGHAVNHLLIQRRMPNQSGLEFLPLERLENLSMWFEKWVYHRDLENKLTLDSGERDGLSLARRVKMLEYRRTHLERGITAALDLAVHGSGDVSLRSAFAGLDDHYRVSQHWALGDFLGYFTWPMFQANPGANFAYLWGAADSAQKFAPFLARPLRDAPGPDEVQRLFSGSFDPDEPSTQPDAKAVFEFYDASALAEAR
jgi:oligopeptidase A